MLPILAPIITALAQNGLGILAGALQAKGKEVIEEKLGVKIPDTAAALTPEKLAELKIKEIEHEEFLVNAAVRRAEIDADLEKTAAQEVTKRWEADMLSDSYLSKNIRPLSFAGVLGGLALFAILSAFNVKIDPAYIALFGELVKIMAGAYFIGRTVEKGIDIHQGWKQTKGE